MKEQWEAKHEEWGLTDEQRAEWQPVIDNDMKEFGLHIVQNTQTHTANGETVKAEVLMIVIKNKYKNAVQRILTNVVPDLFGIDISIITKNHRGLIEDAEYLKTLGDHNMKRHNTVIIPVRNVVPAALEAKYTSLPDSPTVTDYFIKQHVKFELTLNSERTGTILALVPNEKYNQCIQELYKVFVTNYAHLGTGSYPQKSVQKFRGNPIIGRDDDIYSPTGKATALEALNCTKAYNQACLSTTQVPEDRKTKRKFSNDAGFTTVVEIARGVSFGDTTSTSTGPSYKDALDDSRSQAASATTIGETLGDGNESYVSLITTMQETINSNITSLSATMQSSLTQISDTFMKNSEAERQDRAAERDQRAEQFRIMMQSHREDREAAKSQHALMQQMYQKQQAENKSLLDVVTQFSQTQFTQNQTQNPSQGGGQQNP